MKLIPQPTWHPRAGTEIRWQPTTRVAQAAASAPAAGPPSFLQQDHLGAYAGRPDDAGAYNAWTAVTTRLDGTLDVATMTAAFADFIAAHEGLRTYFVPAGDGVSFECLLVSAEALGLVADPEYAAHDGIEDEVDDDEAGDDDADATSGAPVKPAFEAVEIGPTPRGDDTRRHLVEYTQQTVQPFSYPGWVFSAITHDDSFTLYWAADHAFTDGASQAFVLSEIADRYERLLGHDAPQPIASAGIRAYVTAEQERAATVGPEHPAVIAWAELFDACDGRVPRFPLDLGLADGESAPVKALSVPMLSAQEAAAFDAAAKAAGGRASSAVIAAVAATDQALAGITTYAGTTVLSTRHYGDFATTQGWCCTFAPIVFDLDGAQGVAEILPLAHVAFNRARAVAEVPAHAALGQLMASGRLRPEAITSPNMLSYLDLRWVPGAGRQADLRAEHFTGEGRTANGSMWINRDADGLYIAMQSPDTPEAQEAVGRYLTHLRSLIRDIACG